MYLPIETYLVKTSEFHVVNLADETVAKQCMARYGFVYQVPDQTSSLQQDSDGANMSRRYGISDKNVAEQWGYELPPTPTSVSTGTDEVATMSDAEYELLWGHSKTSNTDTVSTLQDGTKVPQGGCLGDASRQMGAHGSMAGGGLAQQIDDESFFQSQASPRVTAAISAWSRCMASGGYNFKTPLDAMSAFAGSSSPSQAEINQALTDINCKAKTSLISTWVSVETSIQNQLIAQNQVALSQDATDYAQLLKYAESIIS